ncbi:hypothetical protein SODALDRAFT_377094 [Sodiomyces alkalinus F11]|uniref:Uncharacterized protein n=1 Tax=Sodiomyces alkalinus (strain CBS 110278 / VKM F-3762 / F11) TaxID=1314773 RepID=A0A3N2Q3U1_SODAK|nr:hypothetical protein SODALDRAFT_377094 [Sodiomyces alkalinus F11]ROT41423.1 hypothetical protein SODALDRAFT_377094 [Sodiomyces alkalinus F11]
MHVKACCLTPVPLCPVPVPVPSCPSGSASMGHTQLTEPRSFHRLPSGDTPFYWSDHVALTEISPNPIPLFSLTRFNMTLPLRDTTAGLASCLLAGVGCPTVTVVPLLLPLHHHITNPWPALLLTTCLVLYWESCWTCKARYYLSNPPSIHPLPSPLALGPWPLALGYPPWLARFLIWADAVLFPPASLIEVNGEVLLDSFLMNAQSHTYLVISKDIHHTFPLDRFIISSLSPKFYL